jgi:hydrogenase maturation protein HypF
VIGFALDGTGYGSDGRIWGGEVLVAGYAGFERAAHLAYVPLPGGAAAIREPWRMAVSYLAHHFGRDFLDLAIPFVRQLDRRKTEVVLRMMEQQVNSPLTSSCGRLFDAVAALAGLRQEVNYEAQAAIELEMAMQEAEAGDAAAYPFELLPQGEGWAIGSAPLFGALVEDLKHNQPASIISRRFHNGLVEVLLELARRLRRQRSLDRVCLSGGTFQNLYLLEQVASRLEVDGFQVFTHSEVPAGDGGLSLGQAMVAARQVAALR